MSRAAASLPGAVSSEARDDPRWRQHVDVTLGVDLGGPSLHLVAQRRDFEDEISNNRRWTWVLLIASFLLLAVVGTVASLALGGGWVGVIFGVAMALGLTLLSYFKADSLALGSTGAHPASVEQYLQLHNLVESMSIS